MLQRKTTCGDLTIKQLSASVLKESVGWKSAPGGFESLKTNQMVGLLQMQRLFLSFIA